MSKAKNISAIIPPKAKVLPKELSIHGDTRIDNYFWLNDRDDQEVIDYLNAENDYTDKVLGHTKPFQVALFEELKGRIKEDDTSVPYLSNGYYYYYRFEEGKEYPIHCRKKGHLDAEEEILLDVNILAADHAYYGVGARSVSDNNQILAFAEDTVSRRIYTIKFKDLTTGTYLNDEIPNTSGGVAWAKDNQTVFYTLKDKETLRSYRIMRHVLGTPVESDVEIYTEEDDTFFSGVYRSRSNEFLMIYSHSTLTTEFQYLSADDPNGYFKVIQNRVIGLEYEPYHFGDHFYIWTNADNAKNYKLVRTPVNQTSLDNWLDVIPHRKDILLESILVFKEYLVLQERIKGISEIKVMPWVDFDKGYYVDFEEAAHAVDFGANEEFDTDELRFLYTSMTTPQSVFDFNLSTKARELKKERPVLGDFNKEDYQSERILVTVRDGVEVPVSMVYKKGFQKNGSQPFLLYSYGSYGHSLDPGFSPARLSLLNRGFGFAIAHIRGGQELGRQWYDDGKLLHKKNTFYDFIDIADWLIQNNYTSKEKLFAMGGSAGGLLMGAIANMRPDLWKGVLAIVPFVDVVTTMLDESIPLTTFEWDEWGNPKDKAYYDYIKSYSPYDNVTSKEYPNMLVTTGLHDSQVQYWEPAKWVAKLRALKTDSNLLLLKTNMEAGHGGASGRFEPLKEIALQYVFMFDLLDINQ
ncbi:MAG: S9 family peptidase [Chitinophagales bacterium]